MLNQTKFVTLSVGLLCSAGTVQATTIFNDTFETSLSSGTQDDVNSELGLGRQAGGTTLSSYTESATAGNNGFLNANQALNATDDVLLLRTLNGNGASQSAVDLDTNFASSLANQAYTISFDWYSARSNGAVPISDAWIAVSFGDNAGGINGPNNGSVDAGVLIRPSNASSQPLIQLWRDNSPTALGNFLDDSDPNTDGWGDRFNIVITVDETAGIGSSTISIVTTPYTSDAATTLDLARQTVFAAETFDFENADTRFIELRAHQGGAGTNGLLHDARFDNLNITVIPEPGSLALLGLSGLLVARRRR